MEPENKKEVRKVILWGGILFLAVNGFSWNPGWGSRLGEERLWELDRYFGWPACFYCDSWRSRGDQEINFPAYIPIFPLVPDMDYVTASVSLLAFLLNLAFAASVTGAWLVFSTEMGQRLHDRWKFIGGGLAIIALLIARNGDRFSTYL